MSKVTPFTVSRREREETPIKDTADTPVRLMAVERLELAFIMCQRNGENRRASHE